MSYQYDRYLAQHKSNVEAGFRWLQKNLPEITEGSGAEQLGCYIFIETLIIGSIGCLSMTIPKKEKSFWKCLTVIFWR